MATFTQLIAQARVHLLETSASFWTDAELLDLANHGAKDLWRAIVDLHQEHFFTNDETNVSLAASATSLTGVPADCFRIHTLECRDLTSANAVQDLTFEPKDFNHPAFTASRGLAAQSPSGQTIYFCLVNAGAPVGAPSVLVAPKLSAAVNLRLGYVRTLAASELATGATNPIPGESDDAIVYWIVAYALAKSRESMAPDPEWLSLYATAKKNLLTALTPRQTVEPDFVDAMFEEYW